MSEENTAFVKNEKKKKSKKVVRFELGSWQRSWAVIFYSHSVILEIFAHHCLKVTRLQFRI